MQKIGWLYVAFSILILLIPFVVPHEDDVAPASDASSVQTSTQVPSATDSSSSEPAPEAQSASVAPSAASVASPAEKQDLSKYGCKKCILEKGKYATKIDEKEGVLSYKESKIQLSEFPEGTQFIATEQGIRVILPQKLNKLFEKSSFLVDTKETELELPDGQKMKGKVVFTKGQLAVLKGDSATIDNILIKSDKNDVSVSFKQEKFGVTKGGNYLYLGDSLVAHGDGFTAQLLPGNKYANVEKGDFLMLGPQNGGTMTLEPRKGTVPALSVTGPSGKKEWGTLWNGNYKTTFGEKGIVKNSIEELFGQKKGTVPLQVDVVDAKGNHLIKDKNGKPHLLLYDNQGRQFVLPPTAKVDTSGVFVCQEAGRKQGIA